jgi:hypothetical protein
MTNEDIVRRLSSKDPSLVATAKDEFNKLITPAFEKYIDSLPLLGDFYKAEIAPRETEHADLTRLENMPTEYNWIEEFDDNDNSIWVLTSPYEEGFKFRLKQRLVNNAIEWREDHDPELINWAPFGHSQLEDAKEWIETCYRNILADNSA